MHKGYSWIWATATRRGGTAWPPACGLHRERSAGGPPARLPCRCVKRWAASG
ncbi:hypothetical protein YSA_08977 [Pseudomonas putida ND6]|uniref:Uncharacterized protein n=1 Tax=Pseudomonas putida ND6 TaxID=231023 RepID=I3V1J9_PSEPU|nr:hypothetical protein YSA_08977 [Pseudomonas putida ND6]